MKRYLPQTWQDTKRMLIVVSFCLAAFFLVLGASTASAQSPDPEQSGSVGITGSLGAEPPTQAAVITFPTSGQTFSDVPVPVGGLCEDGLLIKLFKNNVFAGSAMCQNGTFQINIDLFVGTNELIARVYDSLDQVGPDSNVVTVTFISDQVGAGPRVSITSNFAKRGANPGETLTWPISISGGNGPYAISVDWGDGTTDDLYSLAFPGSIDISHEYESSGTYNITIKVTDGNGVSAFLQVVGIANGPLSQTDTTGDAAPLIIDAGSRVIWWPAALAIPFIFTTFWLGKRYTLLSMKKRIERGEHPFVS